MIQIHKKIKSVCLTSLRLPVVMILLCLIVLFTVPFINVFHPKTLTQLKPIDLKEPYVTFQAKQLTYSGYDLVGFAGKHYGYYYSLEKGKCTFFLVPISDNPKKELKNYWIKAKITEHDSSFDEMTESFAQDLNWDKESLLEATTPYLISNEAYHPIIYMLLFWIILIIFLVSTKKFIQSFVGFFNPNLYPVCSFLGKTVQQEILTEAQEELEQGTYIQINDMFITENYFIDLGKKRVSVIPLRDIIWCYRLGNFPLNPLNQNHNYSINYMIRNGSMISIGNKTSDEALEIINAIRATEYDIIIGHSDAKRKLAKKRCE
ncbi:MAG: hypothetical protein K6G64_07015 [Eubacterium sp.]|nr:hypothetical protein [Eubacterium sp.]